MLKKSITYTDYDGNKRTETFWFGLNQAELTKMSVVKDGGLDKYCEKIIETRDGQKLVDIFDELILKSYGEKSLDGKRFIKRGPNGEVLANMFMETEAYNQLFIELMDAKNMVAFIRGIVPSDLEKTINWSDVAAENGVETESSNIVSLPENNA